VKNSKSTPRSGLAPADLARSPAIALVETVLGDEHRKNEAVVISIVPDLPKLLDARSTRLHGDVIDALVDLVVELVDQEANSDEGQSR
jgi:hypothetical protein